MTLTPLDIQSKEFGKGFRGFVQEEVNDYLDRVSKELESLIKENLDLKTQISKLEEKLGHYSKIEETLHNAIIVAQETAEEVKRNANKEAELIRREAEKDASRMIEDARYKASRILSEHDELYKQAQIFKMRFRSLIEAQLSTLEMENWMQEEEEEVQEERGS